MAAVNKYTARFLTTGERFWMKVNKDGPMHPYDPALGRCWVWIAACFPNGYGEFQLDGRTIGAHRVSYFLTNGEFPPDLACHSCDNHPCCNPAHLFPGTNLDNSRDMVAKGRSPKGQKRPGTGPAGLRNHGAIALEVIEAIRNTPGRVRDVAKLLGVGKSTVSVVRRGQHWSAK